MMFAMMPIHPRHSQAILEGFKTVEMRRHNMLTRWNPGEGGVLMIYETRPTSAVVGMVEITDRWTVASKVVPMRQMALAEIAVSEVEARAYLAGSMLATLIRVSQPKRFITPQRFAPAPRSLRYLTREQGEALIEGGTA